jgi:hypothetical protein
MTDFDLGPRLGNDPLDVLRHVLRRCDWGLAFEFGVASGNTLRLIAENRPLVVYGFDSFEGLPEDWRPGFPAGMFATAPPAVPEATLVKGAFDVTLPAFVAGFKARWDTVGGYDYEVEPVSLVHIDCDLYSSTKTVLEHVGPLFTERPGTFVVFDEFHGYPGCEAHEQRAWAEFVQANRVDYEVVGHGLEQWAVRIR